MVTVPINGFFLAAAALALLLLDAADGARAAGRTRALVIGIDAYRHGTSLKGAVNDAEDIARTLRRIGVADVSVLLDDAASRDRITRAWRDLLARSAPGDLVVLTYAGHGSQEPERVAGSEADGQDEVLLLGGFSERGPGTRERLIDYELNQWLTDAGAKGVEVLFVADTCHSGTLTRSWDSRSGDALVRYSGYVIEADELTLDLPAAAATVAADDLPHVTFLAGSQEYEKVP